MSDRVDQVILTGMARALWVWAWSVWGLDEGPPVTVDERSRNLEDISILVPFLEWDDEKAMSNRGYDWRVPTTPRSAFSAALDLARAYLSIQSTEEFGRAKPTLSTLLEVAMMADEGVDDLRDDMALVFGERLATMALRHHDDRLVPFLPSWFSNHELFDLVLPEAEVRFARHGDASTHLSWLVIARSAVDGTMPTSQFGDDFRVDIERIVDGVVVDVADDDPRLEHNTTDQGNDADVVVDLLMEQWSPGEEFFEVVAPGSYERMELMNAEVGQYRWRYTVHGLPGELVSQIDETIRDTDAERARAFAAGAGGKFKRCWGRLVYLNESDRTYKKHTFVLWAGQHSSERYVIYASGLEDAVEELIEYIAEEHPGMLANDTVNERFAELKKEWEDEHEREYDSSAEDYKLEQEAEEDTTSDGQGNLIDSDDLGLYAEDPSDEELREIAHRL